MRSLLIIGSLNWQNSSTSGQATRYRRCCRTVAFHGPTTLESAKQLITALRDAGSSTQVPDRGVVRQGTRLPQRLGFQNCHPCHRVIETERQIVAEKPGEVPLVQNDDTWHRRCRAACPAAVRKCNGELPLARHAAPLTRDGAATSPPQVFFTQLSGRC